MKKLWWTFKQHGWLKVVLIMLGCTVMASAFAALGATTSLGGVAENLTRSFKGIGHLMIAISYIAGVGFGIASVFKFKQHKDNPTQIPLGTPLALVAIAIVLVFIPAFFSPAGKTLGVTGEAGGFTGKGVTNLPGYTG